MRRTGGSPAITISKQKFNLNSAAGEIFRRTNAKFVHVFWDASAHKVAVRPTLKADSQTYALIMPAEKRNVSFTAQAFLKHIGWNDPEACTVPTSAARAPTAQSHWMHKATLM
jgi:hypothetical protein